ncbi:MAG: hypothetical protein ACT4PV_03485 [Planctomycetaceae bacterium]
MRIATLFVLLAVAALLAPRGGAAEELNAGILGTWRLVSREMADKKLRPPPHLVGLLTYTKEFRNFNVSWADAQGKRFTLASISKYTLTREAYAETSLHYLVHDEIGGKALRYEPANAKGSAGAMHTDEGVELQLPLHGEPYLVFRGETMTATREGEFIDHWERVK